MNLHDIPWAPGIELIEDLVAEGMTEEEAVEKTAEFIDALLKLDSLVPAPYGQAAEALDGPIIEALLRAAWHWCEHSDARKAKRAERKAARSARRSARKSSKG